MSLLPQVVGRSSASALAPLECAATHTCIRSLTGETLSESDAFAPPPIGAAVSATAWMHARHALA